MPVRADKGKWPPLTPTYSPVSVVLSTKLAERQVVSLSNGKLKRYGRTLSEEAAHDGDEGRDPRAAARHRARAVHRARSRGHVAADDRRRAGRHQGRGLLPLQDEGRD